MGPKAVDVPEIPRVCATPGDFWDGAHGMAGQCIFRFEACL